MNPEKVNLYGPCDKAIKAMDREALKAFAGLKLAKWDEIQIIRAVVRTYEETVRKARKHYYEVAFEAYILGLMFCGKTEKEAHAEAERVITPEWVDAALAEVDPVTKYRFTAETERKAQRLAEALEEPEGRNLEIEKALRFLTRQLAQYAIAFTDYAVEQAYHDSGVPRVMWVTMRDEKVCGECGPLDGRIFPAVAVPPKPHWNCRCRIVPVR